MSFFEIFRTCMSKKGNALQEPNTQPQRETRHVFNADNIPKQIENLIILVAQNGVAVTDLFRRPGNTQDIGSVIGFLKNDLERRSLNPDVNFDLYDDAINNGLIWDQYNFYTLANIIKRYLLQIENGIMGVEAEKKLLETLELPDDQSRIESMSRVLASLPENVNHLLSLLFGTWFRMIYHSDVNAMSVEAVAKSVAGSIFPSTTHDPNLVNKASKVMEYLITGFASAELFGKNSIQYFTSRTRTSISRIEKFKYEFIFPKNVSKKKSSRLFVRMLFDEADKHGFNLERDEVTPEEFNAIDNCITLDGTERRVQNQNGYTDTQLSNPRKRRLSSEHNNSRAVNEDPPTTSQAPTDQVQQTSEKRTCVIATNDEDYSSVLDGATEDMNESIIRGENNGLTTTSSTMAFDSLHHTECNHSHNQSDDVVHSPVNRRNSSLRKEMDEIIRYEVRRQNASNTVNDGVTDVTVTIMPVDKSSQKDAGNTKSNRTMPNNSETIVNNGNRFSQVQNLQMQRLQQRTAWFMSSPSGCQTTEGHQLMQLSPNAAPYSPAPNSSRAEMVMSICSEDQEATNIRMTRFYDFNNASCAPLTHPQASAAFTNRHSAGSRTLPTQVTSNMIPDQSDQVMKNDQRKSVDIEDEIEVRYFAVRKIYGTESYTVTSIKQEINQSTVETEE